MALTSQEIDSLRFHLGYGNLTITTPYTPDTFLFLFEQVISPSLSTGLDTMGGASGVTYEPGIYSLPVDDLTGVTPGTSVVVDVGEDSEVVVVKSVTIDDLGARFAKPHFGRFPVGTLFGVTRLRSLLWQAQTSHGKLVEQDVMNQSGVKRADEIEWFEGYRVLSERLNHYMGIIGAISQLVNVKSNWPSRRCTSRLEAY